MVRPSVSAKSSPGTAGCRRRASAIMPAETSSASTERQLGASAAATRPKPQPKSSTSVSAATRCSRVSHATISAVAACRMAGSPSEYSATPASGEWVTAWSKNAAMPATPPSAVWSLAVVLISAARLSRPAARPSSKAARACQRGVGGSGRAACTAAWMVAAPAPPSSSRARAIWGEITPRRHSSSASVTASRARATHRPRHAGCGRRYRCASGVRGRPRWRPAHWPLPWRRQGRRQCR